MGYVLVVDSHGRIVHLGVVGMGLQDVKGVFSQFFVVGFFAPAFFMLVVLRLLVGEDGLPQDYQSSSEGTQLLIIGGAALLTALLLSGLNRPLMRTYEKGYLLKAVPPVGKWAVARWQYRFDQLVAMRAQESPSPERTAAARRLDDQFPQSRNGVLPTRLGNVMRASEAHPRVRYNLNGVMIWPRIALLLSAEEHERLTNERTTFAFFLNASFLSVLVGGAWAASLLDTSASAVIAAGGAVLVAATVAWVLYVAACDAAMGYGYAIRSAVDLHRFDLYERLGVERPTTIAAEQDAARAVNRCLRFGEPIPDKLRAKIGTKESQDGR